MIANDPEPLNIRGGGLLGGFSKYLLLPLALGISPIILVNVWASESDFSKALILIGSLLGIFAGVGLFINLVSYFSFHLVPKGNGDLSVRAPATRRQGSAQIDTNILKVTSVRQVSVYGLHVGLFQGEELIAEWSTKPISLPNMRRFLQRLKEINPAIQFDANTAEIAERGTTRNLSRAFSRVLLPLMIGLGIMLYLPTVELVCIKLQSGQLNWVQLSLQDMLYLSLVPLTFPTLAFFFMRGAEPGSSSGLPLGFGVLGLVPLLALPFVPSLDMQLINLVAQHHRVVAIVTLVILLAFMIVSQPPAQKVLRILVFLLAGSFTGAAIVWHAETLRDFFQPPIAIKNVPAIVDAITFSHKNGVEIDFHLQDRSDKQWSFHVPQRSSVDTGRILPSGRAVNLYSTPNMETLLKVEDAQTSSIIYWRLHPRESGVRTFSK